MLTNGGHHHVFPPRTYQIADQGTARGSKSGHNHKGIPEILRTTLVTAKARSPRCSTKRKNKNQVEREIKFCIIVQKDTSSILRSLRQL